jgi:hypothetical protein
MRFPLQDRTEDYNALLQRVAEEQRADIQDMNQSNVESLHARGNAVASIIPTFLKEYRQAKEENKKDARMAEEQAQWGRNAAAEGRSQQQFETGQKLNSLQISDLERQGREAKQQEEFMNAPAEEASTKSRRQKAWELAMSDPEFQRQMAKEQLGMQKQGIGLQQQGMGLQKQQFDLTKQQQDFSMNQQRTQWAANLYKGMMAQAGATGQQPNSDAVDQQLAAAGYKPQEVVQAKLLGNVSDPMVALYQDMALEREAPQAKPFAADVVTANTALKAMVTNAKIYEASGSTGIGPQAESAVKNIAEALRSVQMTKEADNLQSAWATRVANAAASGGAEDIYQGKLIKQYITTAKQKVLGELTAKAETLPLKVRRMPQISQALNNLQSLGSLEAGKNDAPLKQPARPTTTIQNAGGAPGGLSIFRPQP